MRGPAGCSYGRHVIAVPRTFATQCGRATVLVRSMDYLLWGLRHGLTDDPPKCGRLLSLFG